VPKNKPAKKKPETKKPEPIKNRTSAREVPTGTRTRVKGGYKGATPIKKMSTRATPRTRKCQPEQPQEHNRKLPKE
jgi:hypothetical protein